jgi:sulfoxide reductase heme-binding subunit YedZ
MKALAKPLVFILCLLPAAYYFHAVYLAFSGGENLLGPDPAKALSLATGEWAIRMLILALAITPIRSQIEWPFAWQFRRMTGLFALFYATLHLLVFLMFLLQWQWAEIGAEIAERPFITLGFSAWLLLLPLGITSFNSARRKLGRNWKKLHRLVYVINVLAVLHVIWIVRSSYGDALLYGGLVTVLLGYRLLRHYSEPVRRFSFRRFRGKREASRGGA